MIRTIFFTICLSLLVLSCSQKQDSSVHDYNEHSMSLGPNPELAKLLSSSFDETTPYKTIDQWAYMAENIFTRPEGSVVVNDVKLKHPNNSHPRILLTKESLATLKQQIKNDSLYKQWFNDVLEEANNILLIDCVDKPKRHELQNRLLPLGLAYKITDDTKYAQRAWLELNAYINFEHWNPTTQFLDIAYITKGFAIGFDWFYDHLDADQKQLIVNAVTEKALKLAMVAYHNPTDRIPYQNSKITGYDNWNSSINAGLMMVSLAICDEEGMEKLCGDVLHFGLKYWENYLKEFAPDGGCVEGVGYWYWGVQSVVEGIASFESATGSDYGTCKTPGLSSSAYFPLYMTGPQGAFNFGNAKAVHNIKPDYYWFAQKYQDPKLAQFRKQFMERSNTKAKVYDLIWYNPDLINGTDVFEKLPLDMMFLRTETASFRSSWNDDAFFIALKGGDNMATHGHLNTGSFVLDALGERWAVQLGADSYSNPGYFTKGERNSQGYQYYRVRAEGQNTILINPDGLSDQLPRAVSHIEEFATNTDQAHSIINMTQAYSHEAVSVKRGIKIANARKNIILRDEIRCLKASQIYWFMHTPAKVSISEDGKTASLSLNGKKLSANLFCSVSSAKFSLMDAKPLPTSPQSKYNKSNKGIQKLCICIDSAKDVDISVVFSEENSQILEQADANLAFEEW